MTPEQKAKELIERFSGLAEYPKDVIDNYVGKTRWIKRPEVAKACALICVEEVLIGLKFTNDSKHYADQAQYWQQVKSLLNSEQEDKRSDATEADSSNAAGSKTKS